ncbi:MAG: site-2 protease family protein [Oscillospiraceae bacterium]|nr:site-2 protease family protein [Oscillospiraceae bacterium]
MSVLFAILLFSFLIFIHEFGHFAAAKLSGVQVNEFAMFMGPALWKKQIGETLYSVRLIPIGGYCAMEGEEEDTENPRSFQKAAWWKRLIILVAGAAMNFLMGILLMFIVYMPAQAVVEPVIASFEEFSTVDGEQGLQIGDRILELDGEKIYVQSDFSLILSLNPGDYHDLVVERNGRKVELPNLHMEKHEVTREDGSTQWLFGMNFTLQELSFPGKIRYAWYQCLDTVRMVRLSLQMLLNGQAGFSDLSGPVGIVQQISTVAEASPTALDALLNMLYFGAFIAINLAVMNLLPLPALDGGRVVGVLVTAAVEAISKRKINPKYEGYLHGAGMIFLLGLMAVVMFKDIFVLFRG